MGDMSFSRISKLFLDLGHASATEVMKERANHAVLIRCGDDVGESAVLQLVLLTCANLASRCFPGAVRIAATRAVLDAPALTAAATDATLGDALIAELGENAIVDFDHDESSPSTIILGNVDNGTGGLRVTFDGWIAAVGPAAATPRLRERPFCPLVGVLAGGLAVSEIFMAFAQVTPAAMRRPVSVSLWAPNLPAHHDDAVGEPLEFLPGAFWVLGLGHLGNALLWALTALPYPNRGGVTVYLNDYDCIEPENVETSMLFQTGDSGLKTRTAAAWLHARGFQTRLVERPFGHDFRRHPTEPGLAFCGFDSNPARQALATADFRHVMELGLGGNASNFDTISFHRWPNPRPANELWPDAADHSPAAIAELIRLTQSAGYVSLGADECGRYEYAGKAIAVPFIGAVAASLAVAEALRLLHRGPAYHQLKFCLGPKTQSATPNRAYSAADAAGLAVMDVGSIH